MGDDLRINLPGSDFHVPALFSVQLRHTALMGEILAGRNFREFREVFAKPQKLVLAKYFAFAKSRK